MNYKALKFEMNAVVKDAVTGEVLGKQSLSFSGTAPAIHGAVEKMGASFVYGLGVSIGREMLGLPAPGAKDGEPKK